MYRKKDDKNGLKQEQNTETKTNQFNNKYRNKNENENQSTSCEKHNNEDHDNVIECSERKKWIHYECTDLPPYMMCSLTEGRRKYSCQNCVDNDEIPKYTKILNKKKEKHNRKEITTEEKEIENLKVLLEEKEQKINILEETQSKNGRTISVMKEEIENCKNKKQIQTNSIK